MKPIKVDDVNRVFGGKTHELVPKMNEIPKEFQYGKSKWNKVFGDWFFYGLENCVWTPKKDVNKEDALRHIGAVMRSYEIKHEHKEAGVAFLLNEFFEDVQYDKAR